MAQNKAPKAHIEGSSASAAPSSKPQPTPQAERPRESKRERVVVETTAPEEPQEETAAPTSSELVHEAAEAGSGHGPGAWVSKTFPGNEHAFMGGVVGLVVAAMVFAIGFWRTLLVTLLVVVGIALGQYLDGNPKIINTIRRLLAGAGAEQEE